MAGLQMVFGTGSARCGSKSLAVLFGEQPRVAVNHEAVLLPWECDVDLFRQGIRDILHSPKQRSVTRGDVVRWLAYDVADPYIVGDIGPSYLMYTELLVRNYSARIICLKRDKGQTVDSFLRQQLDHCSLHPEPDRMPGDAWWPVHPKYDLPTRKAAVEAYWDEFYTIADQMQSAFPASFRIWDTEALNYDEDQRDMMEFAGVPRNAVRCSVVDRRYTKYSCRLMGGDGGNGPRG